MKRERNMIHFELRRKLRCCDGNRCCSRDEVQTEARLEGAFLIGTTSKVGTKSENHGYELSFVSTI
jgi:hypothetical protein